MKTAINKRLLIVWIILSAITVSYLWIDHPAGGAHAASVAVTVTAIVLALVKVRIIMREFMEVRLAPPLLRHLTDLLVVVMAVALLGTYFAGRAVA